MSEPTVPPESWETTELRRSDVRDPRAVRDAVALLLMVLGALGLVTVLFLAHPLAGAGAIAGTALIGGILLGLDR